MSTLAEQVTELTAGLQSLAGLLTRHPELPQPYHAESVRLLAYVGGEADARGVLVGYATAGLTAGAAVTETVDENYAGLDVVFGPVTLHVYAPIDQVHEVKRTVECTTRPILDEITNAAPVAA